jgi:outer membrane receptor protein involved in Fe transport
MKKHKHAKRALLAIWALTLPFIGVAQDAPDASDDLEVFELGAFVVNTDRDYGYVAVDSLAGGRVNTPIKFTPSSISSLTSAFLEDLAILDVREALRWAPNVVPANPDAGKGFGGSAFHSWSFNYRSAGAGQQGGPGPTRNYFSFYQNADSYNIDRIEFLRGPNSLVFGLGTVGGTLSIYTKQPRTDQDFYTPTITVDDNGSFRAELDANMRLSDNFSARLNAVGDEHKGWRKNDEDSLRAVTLALLYRPSVNTSFRLEGEIASMERTLIGSQIADKLSGWDGSTASETWGEAPTGTARTEPIQNPGAWGSWLNPFPVWVPSLGDNALMHWAGGYASTTSQTESWGALPFQPRENWYPDEVKLPWHSDYASTADIPVLPSDDWTYGNGISDIEYKDFTGTIEHRFNENFEGTVAVYRYEDDQTAQGYEGTGGAAIDINKQLPNGSSNPNYGKPFADFFLSRQNQSRSVTEARAQINYNFAGNLFGQPYEQLFSASAAYKKVKITARQYLAQLGDGTPPANVGDWVQNMVWGRIYLDEPNNFMHPPEFAPDGTQITYAPKADGYWFDFDDDFKLKDVAFLSHTRLFDESLSILAGVRHDKYDEKVRELRRGPNLSDLISEESESGTTYSAGAVYYFDWFGLFANYSENIQPPNPGSQPMLDGNRPSPEKGKGLDYGVRISTGDNRYYVTLSRYDTKSEGHLVENPIALRGIWQRYFDAQSDLTRDPNLNDLAYSDTTSRDVTGWEFEVTANPTDNIRLTANYAKPDAIIVDYYPHARKYFADNLDTWNTGIANADTEELGNALRLEIANVQNALDQSLPGAIQPGSVKYTTSLYAHYTFLEDDWIPGLSIGAGISQTGRSYAGIFDDEVYWGSDVRTTHAVIAYETKIWGYDARFALNIENIFDDNDPIVTSYHWGYTGRDGVHIPEGYYMQAPRTFRFSARFTF